MITRLAAALLILSPLLMGQGVAIENLIHIVQDLDRSVEFYRDGLGLKLNAPPAAPLEDPAIASLYDVPGSRIRTAAFLVPDSEMILNLIEFQGVDTKPIRSRYFDPGNATLYLPAADLEGVKRSLLRFKGLEWVDASKFAFTVRDPDGMVISINGSNNGLRGKVSLLVDNLDRSAQLYRDVLGFTATTRDLRSPDDSLSATVQAATYVDRKPIVSSVHDPGATVLQLRVSEFDAILSALKSAGATVVSTGAATVNLGGVRSVILRDPDNHFLQLLEGPA